MDRRAGDRSLRRRLRCGWLVALLAAVLMAAPAAARQRKHDPQEAGHPLRLIGYIAYPVGLLIDTLIFRPCDWLVQHEPMRTIFGYDVEN